MRKILFYLLFISAFLGPAVSYHGIYLFHFALLCWSVNFVLEERFNGKYWLDQARRSKFFWIVPALLGWFCLSLLWAESFKQGLIFIAQLGMSLGLSTITVIELNRHDNQQRFHKIMLILLVLTLVTSLLEATGSFRWPISQYNPQSEWFGYTAHVPFDWFEAEFIKITPTSFYWNSNNLSLVLVMFLPFLGLSKRNIAWIGAFTIVMVIFLAGSRLALMVCILQAVLMFLFIKPRPIKLFLGIIAALVLIISLPQLMNVIFPNAATPDFLVEKSVEVSPLKVPEKYVVERPLGDNSVSVRKVLLDRGIDFFIHSKGLGVGAGSSRALLAKEGGIGRNHITNMHNFWLELACEGGLVVLIALGAFVLLFLQTYWKVLMQTRADNRSMMTAKLVAGIGAFFAVIGLSTAVYFLPLYIFFGYLVSSLNTAEEV